MAVQGDVVDCDSDAVRGAQRELPWEAVKSLDWRGRANVVTDLSAGRAAPPESLKRTVLLRRDVMDALLIDVEGRQIMRGNDLWLRDPWPSDESKDGE